MKLTNYPEDKSLGSPEKAEDSLWSDHVTRILPPKEYFRKLLDSTSPISEEDMEEERALFPDLRRD